MVCPRCRATFDAPPEACQNCGYDFALSQVSLPFAPPPLEFVMNPAGLLPDTVADDVSEAYAAFRKRFPQIQVSFCFIQLTPGIPLSEFAFWLFNTAPDPTEDRAWRMLVTIDLGAGQLSVNSGYALEPFIDPAAWSPALNSTATACAKAEWSEALTHFLHHADAILTTAWEVAASQQKKTGASS